MDVRLNDLTIEKFDSTLFDILDHGHTHYTFPGGRGGTKSSFIGTVIPLLITQHPGVHAAVFRKVTNTLRDSVYSQIIAGINALGLSTVKNAKAIMVLEQGQIVERGSHDELIEAKGRYYQLYTGKASK